MLEIKFTNEQIITALQNMIRDMKCCGNCKHNIAMFCQKNEHPVEAYKCCADWESDYFTAGDRRGIIMTDPNNLIEHTFAWEIGEGLSLRDYFAGQAMQVFLDNWINNPKLTDETDGIIAHKSYEIADAMLKAREK